MNHELLAHPLATRRAVTNVALESLRNAVPSSEALSNIVRCYHSGRPFISRIDSYVDS